MATLVLHLDIEANVAGVDRGLDLGFLLKDRNNDSISVVFIVSLILIS